MCRVLAVATRKVFGDLFCIRKWERTENLVTWSPDTKMFFITVHNLTPSQVDSENLRRYLACMGDITTFSYPVPKADGRFSITVRAFIRYKQRLRFSVRAENEMGFSNDINFEFHNFPNNFCGFCNLIGHKLQNYADFILAQQHAEEQQAATDIIMEALNQYQQAEPNNQQEEPQQVPVMTQHDLALQEDSLSSASAAQAQSEWDFALPAPKRIKITEIDSSSSPTDQDTGETRSINIIEPQLNTIAYPYEWFKGETSASNPAKLKENSKGRDIADDNN